MSDWLDSFKDNAALVEALAEKAWWFGFDSGTGEYTAEYCRVRPYDDRGMVPMVPLSDVRAALSQPNALDGIEKQNSQEVDKLLKSLNFYKNRCDYINGRLREIARREAHK